MKKTIFIIITASLAVFLSFSFARAETDFNDKPNLKNWAGIKGPIDTGDKSSLGVTTTSGDSYASFCSDRLFKFQSNNLFVGTFCDLGSIVAVSTAQFATNATCTIQKVAMSNYDNKIEFSPGTTADNTCITKKDGSATNDIFGTGSATGGGSGFYANGATSQLSRDINDGTYTDSSGSDGTWIYRGYALVRNFATVAALAALLLFAFANILHLDINTYTIKKMIPNIIIAVVGSYLSIYVIYLLSRAVDFLYRLEFFSPYNSLHPFYNIMSGNLGGVVGNSSGSNVDGFYLSFQLGGQLLGGTDNVSIISGILGVIFLTIPSVVAFAFEYVLALRPIAVGLLTVLSPIAFAAYVFPTGQNIFRKWVTLCLIAIFYTPAVNLTLYIINFLPTVGDNALMMVLMVLVKTAVFVFLIRLPFTIESDIQKITLALGKANLGNALGVSKGAETNVKIKQDNKTTVTDKILESKAAKSLIAPINNTYRRDIVQEKVSTNENRRIFSQIINRNVGPRAKDINRITDKAHQNNLARSSNLLVNSVADLSPQAIQKITSSSNHSVFKDTPLVNELKVKNGQLLDDEGAATRADAARKLFRQAQVIDRGQISNPEAVKLMAQKQMLPELPLEVVKKSLDQGIITQDDIRANFQNNQAQNFRSKALNANELKTQMDTDFADSKTGFSDLLYAISANQSNLKYSPQNVTKIVESIRNDNQGEFDKNGLYYLSRLNQVQDKTKETLSVSLKQAGVPAQTANSLSQNPSLTYEQVASYVPQTAAPESLNVIKETIAERSAAQTASNQVASSLKEDKVMLGQVIGQKVSESLKNNSVRGFDDVKSQITGAIKTLETDSNPENVKKAVGTINNFAPVPQMQTAGQGQVDTEKAKEKGESVISVIQEMQSSGVSETTLAQNPAAANEQYSNQVQQTINNVASGKQKPSAADNLAPNTIEENMTNPDQPDAISQTIGKVISTDTKDGKSFDQQLGDISQAKKPTQTSQESNPQPGAING